MAGSLSIKENPIDLAMMEFRFYESLTGIYEIGEIKIDAELILRDATGTELIKQSYKQTEFYRLGLLCFGIFLEYQN